MISTFEMLEVLISDPNFNLTQEFELVRKIEELNEDRIGGSALNDYGVVIGNPVKAEKVSGMLVKRLRTYDGIDTINDTKVCGQKADAIYALTNAAGDVYYFIAWYISK